MKMKRILSLVLCLCMMASVFSMSAFADEYDPFADLMQQIEQAQLEAQKKLIEDAQKQAEQQLQDILDQLLPDEPEQPEEPEEDKEEDKKPADKKEDDKKEESKPAANYGNAVELLTNVWATYGEAELFPAGYIDEAGNMVDGPAKIGTADSETLDALLGVPADKAGSIDNASIMMHMMNANTFTGGAYKTSDAKGLSDSIQANLANRQWMCGFPDILVTIQVEDYLISAFGNAELIETFKNKVTATYGNAKVLCEEPLAF